MFRYVSSGGFPRQLTNPNRVLTGTVNRVIYIDSDSSDYSSDSDSSDSDSDSGEEIVREYCTRSGAHAVWTTAEWERSGGCDCKDKKKKTCGLMKWLGCGKKKKKTKRKTKKKKCKRKDCGCGCGGHLRRHTQRVEVQVPLCGGCGEGSRGEHRGCSCRGGHGRRRRRYRDEYDEDSEDDERRAVYRRRHERRRDRSREVGGYRAPEGERFGVPVDVDYSAIRRPMNARVVLERNDEEEAYGMGMGMGMGMGRGWEPPIAAV